ncbi:hypothetical protein pdam_00017664 [Pocillopora damicornis]|uniref:RING-type domain-containing protein n=1 Tax=Pocillopora damicornis TaxID=46731 RepID=A0A3M6THM8_POCDA|nr:hypothetical protein pdam_00017664 [Pocillopora damicornis]
MATGGYHGKPLNTEEDLQCPVCLEIFENPISIPCGHTFCSDCLSSVENLSGSSTCPVCRNNFNFNEKRRARDIDRQIRHSTGTCSSCNRQFPMSRLREHRSSCETVSPLPFVPVARTSQPRPEDELMWLVCIGGKREGVCPICASMPWGNPNQKSGDFIQHLNLRHKFEYDTYVDFNNDEDAILQQVLAQSVRDR